MEAASMGAVGNVHVFNLTSEDLNLSTNGMNTAGGTIPGWGGSSSNYQPASQAVPRTLNASDGPGKFFNGRNNLMLMWIDGLFVASVQIDGSMLPLNQDLILLVARNKWHLVTQSAVEVAEGDVTSVSQLREALAVADAQ